MTNPEEIWQCQTNNCGYMYDPEKGDRKGKISKGVKRPLVPGGFQFEVDVNAVVDALEFEHDHKNDKLNPAWRDEMVERSADYRIDNVQEKYMLSTLEKIQGELT